MANQIERSRVRLYFPSAGIPHVELLREIADRVELAAVGQWLDSALADYVQRARPDSTLATVTREQLDRFRAALSGSGKRATHDAHLTPRKRV